MSEEITFDTSGEVTLRVVGPLGHEVPKYMSWQDLSPFVQGYIQAMFKSGVVISGKIITLHELGFSDLAPETLDRILKDCEAVQALWSPRAFPNTHAGGAAFWRDRQSGSFPKLFPPLLVSLGDDGLVYLKEAG